MTAVSSGPGLRGAGLYGRLFAVPAARRLAAADLCARLPQGMLSITVLLVTAQHAPMRVAGLSLAACTLGLAVTAPLRGRVADRVGIAKAAALTCGAYAAALIGLLAASQARQPAALLVALAAAAGCVTPPLSPGLRSLWSRQVPACLLTTAFAVDAALFDLAYIAGPVLASSLAVGIAPAAALSVMLALTAAAITIVGVRFRPAAAGPARISSRSSVRSAALLRLLLTAALTNAALTATEVTLTSYVRLHHALWASGPLLAELSIGSILGSLLLGTRSPAAGVHRRLSRLLGGYALGLAGLAAASLYPPLLALATPLAGLCLGPTLATLFTMVASGSPQGSSTQAQAWINSIMNGGAVGGAAFAGLTASRPLAGFALAAGTALAGALIAASARPAAGIAAADEPVRPSLSQRRARRRWS